MEQINLFTKGLVSDLDPTMVQQGMWVMPTINGRITFRKGYGYVLSTMDGTDKVFELSEGFQLLDAVEHGGIIYIVSGNDTSVEIGSYPSIPNNGSGFTNDYRPIYNILSNGVRLPFNTNTMGYGLSSKVKVLARDDYDGTVNLYIHDGVNPNYCINTGFTIDGDYIERYYSSSELPKLIKQFLVTNEIASLSDFDVRDGGSLKYGNYFIYIRYLDGSYNRTQFVDSFGPIQVFSGNNALSIRGGSQDGISGKSIVLQLTDVDTSFKYIEIGVLRNHGDNNNQDVETWLISSKKPIESSSMEIIITGDEENSIITIEDILRYNTSNACLASDQAINRWFGANWTGVSYNKDAFAEFASRIRIDYSVDPTIESTYHLKDMGLTKYSNSETLPDNSAAGGFNTEEQVGNTSTASSFQQYKSFKSTYSYSGYARGEVYGFMVIAKLSSGGYTEAFPLCGFDNYDPEDVNPGKGVRIDSYGRWLDAGNNLIGTNAKGLYRFPFYNAAWTLKTRAVNYFSNVLSVKFTLTDAISYIQANSSDFNGIESIIFVRTNRFENLMYQGWRTPVLKYVNQDAADRMIPSMSHRLNPGVTPKRYAAKVPITFLTDSSPATHIDQGDSYHGNAVVAVQSGLQVKYLEIPGVGVSSAQANDLPDLHLQTEYAAMFSSDHFFESAPSTWRYNDLYALEIAEPLTEWEEQDSPTTSSDYDYSTSDPYIVTYRTHTTNDILINQSLDQFLSVDAESVEDYDANTSSFGFTSYAEHSLSDYNYFMKDPSYHLTRAGVSNDADGELGNRTLHTGRYIGIRYHSGRSNTEVLKPKLMALYRYKNNEAYFNNLLSTYSVAYAQCREISQPFYLYSLPTSTIEYRGDCFMQRSWRRIMHWHSKAPTEIYMYDSDDSGVKEDWTTGKAFRYEHGKMISFMSECFKNIAMRYADENRTYFPYNITSGTDTAWEFVLGSDQDVYIDEANYYNSGHHVVMPLRTHYGYDSGIKNERLNSPTMIKASYAHSPTAIVDAWRIIGMNAEREYYLEDGAIINIHNVGANLLVVQERGLNQVALNFQGVELPSDSGSTLIGSNEILAASAFKLAQYGSQHVYGTVKTDYGIYGYDVRMAVPWIAATGSDNGVQRITTIDLAEKTANKAFVLGIQQEMGIGGQIGMALDDDIRSGYGVSLGYDAANREVIIALRKGSPPSEYDERQNDSRVILYDMKIQNFVGELSHMYPTRMVQYVDRLFSSYSFNNSIHEHNIGDPLKFHGLKGNWKFSVIVNGMVSESQNHMVYEKIYNSWKANMLYHELKTAYYQTEYQEAEQVLDSTAPFYSAPIHSEGSWNVPIDDQSSSLEHEMGTGSAIRGRWMRLSVEYAGDAFNFVRNLITSYLISKR